jgi:large subunit ribosomal protein L7/L12
LPKKAAPAPDEGPWDVVLVDGGASPIALIRELRELLAMDLRVLKDLVDSLPQTLLAAVPRDEADELKKQLEAAGAGVEVRRASARA